MLRGMLVVSIGCAALAQTLSAPAQESVPTYRVDADEVVVHVLFTDRYGNAITDLTREEVQIFENNTRQEINRFHTTDAPFRVGLLLDSSPSTQEQLPRIRLDSGDFIQSLPEGTEVLVISFDEEVYVDCDWSTDLKRAARCAKSIVYDEDRQSTVLYEAVALTAEQKFERNFLRQALIVYSDGIDEGSKGVSREESLETIQESHLVAYTIQYDSRDHYRRLHNPSPDLVPGVEPPVGSTGVKLGPILVGSGDVSNRDRAEYVAQTKYESGQNYLKELAEAGTGTYFEALQISDLTRAYARIVAELSAMYTLTFLPSEKDARGYRAIRVHVTRPGVAVQTLKRGYNRP